MGNKEIFQKIGIVYLIMAFLLGVAMIVSGVAIEQSSNQRITWQLIISLSLISLGSAIAFPLIVGFVVDFIRKETLGDVIWCVIKEFAEAGVCDFCKSRYTDEAKLNLLQEIKNHKNGEIKIIGVTLKYFFQKEFSHFYESIEELLKNNLKNVSLKVLLCDPDKNPEVLHRSPVDRPEHTKTMVEWSIKSIQNLKNQYGDTISYAEYIEAPYYTSIIFPNKCYLIPNILIKEGKNPLFMIALSSHSPAYEQILDVFESLWEKYNHKVA